MTNDLPKIYVACLAAYNAGYLHGEWIDATKGVNDIRSEIDALLKRSPVPDAEEFAIHDHEGFEGVHIEDYSSLEAVHGFAAFIAEHGTLGGKLLAHLDDDLESAQQHLEDGYVGQFESVAAYAQDVIEQTTKIADRIAGYIDYDAMARDMELNGDIFAIETGHDEVHVFLTL